MIEIVSPHLTVLLLSMTPLIELRGAIPIGLLAFNLPISEVFILSVVGNMVPNFFLLKWLEPIRNFFTNRIKWMDRFYNYIVDRTQRKHSAKFNTVGAAFLATFVAIPLPGSGSWTGCLIAYLYKVPYRKALGLIFLGVVGGAVIVTILTTGTETVVRAAANLLNSF